MAHAAFYASFLVDYMEFFSFSGNAFHRTIAGTDRTPGAFVFENVEFDKSFALLARAFLMPNATGVVVTTITPGGPAERGGLSRGDIILQVDNSKIANANKLRNLIAATRPGSTVKMAVVRGRRTMALLVTVGQGPFAKDEFRPPSEKERWTGLGLTIQDVTADIAAAIGLSEPGGALITEVAAGSPAGRARPVPLTRGDVILEMERVPVRGAQQLRAMLKASKPDARMLLFIYRKGSTLFTVVTMPGSSQAVSDPK